MGGLHVGRLLARNACLHGRNSCLLGRTRCVNACIRCAQASNECVQGCRRHGRASVRCLQCYSGVAPLCIGVLRANKHRWRPCKHRWRPCKHRLWPGMSSLFPIFPDLPAICRGLLARSPVEDVSYRGVWPAGWLRASVIAKRRCPISAPPPAGYATAL